MSDVLIRGIEIPKEGIFWVSIRADGSVSIVTGEYDLPQHGLAIFLPEHHGRLIDADALKDKMIKTRDILILSLFWTVHQL